MVFTHAAQSARASRELPAGPDLKCLKLHLVLDESALLGFAQGNTREEIVKLLHVCNASFTRSAPPLGDL